MSNIEALEPKKVFSFLEEISRIPRGSRNTKEISDYLVRFAKDRGLWSTQDEEGNVVIIQEASEGYEDREPVILQGHMDMVCEKENGCELDFEKDPLTLSVEGDYLSAEGTTLGADDGIALAYILAILDSPELPHPRIEAVFTVDEEIGMLGAQAIDLSMLKGHRMLNIDSEKEGEFLASCAGGMSLLIELPLRRNEQEGRKITVTVDGLLGGHSGDEIGKERANAIILMGRVLRLLTDETSVGVISMKGGGKDNAIPRFCTAELLLTAPEALEDSFGEQVAAWIGELEQTLKKEYSVSDPGVCLKLEIGEKAAEEICDASSAMRLLFFLRTVPNGVQHMSMAIPGLVETSSNLGILEFYRESVHMVLSIRSSVASRMEDLCDRVVHLIHMMGGEAELEGDYPAWEYRENSPLRERIGQLWEQLFGTKPEFSAIHAGLECGVFSEKIEDLDCVSFGPDILDIHTPKERLSISSAERVWKFLLEFLRAC